MASDDEINDLERELEEAGSGKKAKRLTPAEWERLKTLWEYGDHTLVQLSEMFGIRADTIQRRLKEEGVQKGAKAHLAAEKAAAEVEDDLAAQAAETMRRIHQTKDDHYKWSEAIGKMVMQELLNARNERKDVGMKNANLTALGKAAKTLEIIRKERYAILGLDREDGDPDEMDELLVSELLPEQIEALQNEMRGIDLNSDLNIDSLTENDRDNGIVVEGEDD